NLFDQSINQCKITKNLSQNVVHSDSDLILHNSSVLIDKEPKISAWIPWYRRYLVVYTLCQLCN
ncbi:hypothetical protein FIU31_17645, partial [Enterococcus faecium]